MKLITMVLGIAMGTIFLASCQQNTGKVNLNNELDTTSHKNIRKAALNNELDTASYSIGVSIGSSLKKSPMQEVNYDAMLRGFIEVMEDKKTEIDEYQANQILTAYMQKMDMKIAQDNLEAGRKFLKINGQKEGVVTTKSGLQYQVLKEGTGPKPAIEDQVKVHYQGTLLDGTVFDSSLDGDPVTFGVGRVIKGWQEALQLMPVGSKWRIWVPGELGYGIRPMPGGKIKANDLLIFEVELFDIVKKDTNQ